MATKGTYIDIEGNVDPKFLAKIAKDIKSGRVHTHEVLMSQENMDAHKKAYDAEFSDSHEYTFEELREKFKAHI